MYKFCDLLHLVLEILHVVFLLTEYKKEQEEFDYQDCSAGRDNDDERPCMYDLENELGTECTEKNHYGFHEGQPCILLKLNKVKHGSLPRSCQLCLACYHHGNKEQRVGSMGSVQESLQVIKNQGFFERWLISLKFKVPWQHYCWDTCQIPEQ